jgi:hypothetical protein
MTNLGKNISTEAYQQFLAEIVNLVQSHRVAAVQAVQTISNQLYWNIGELIIQKQKVFGWGKSVVEKLSIDLNYQLGDAVSWSPRNLRLMKQIVEEYSNVKQPASDLENIKKIASRVPWQSAEQFQQIFIAGSWELP